MTDGARIAFLIGAFILSAVCGFLVYLGLTYDAPGTLGVAVFEGLIAIGMYGAANR